MRNPARVLCTAALALSVLGGTVATHAMDYMDGSAVRGHGGDLASLYAGNRANFYKARSRSYRSCQVKSFVI